MSLSWLAILSPVAPRRCRVWARSALALMLGAALAGCSIFAAEPELALIYNRSAAFHAPDRNPIIAMPGLLGSTLQQSGSDALVWGAFDGSSANPSEPMGLRMLALPIGTGNEPLANLRDDVQPQAVLEKTRVSLLGIPIELEVYAGIMATLGVGGYRDQSLGLGGVIDYGDDHYTCFQFPYDWRRDIVESARVLNDFVIEKQAYVREQYRERFGIDNPNVKFDIVTHSMGGLVTRYFLMYGAQDLPADGSLPALTWEGARYIERVIFVGTPNAGSVAALENLVSGRDLSPFAPLYPPALLGTFPSVYQLLPRARHRHVVWDGDPNKPIENLLSPALWERLGWGLAAPAQAENLNRLLPNIADASARRSRALEFQAQLLQRAETFMAAMDRSATPPRGLEMFLLAGDGHATPEVASVNSKSGDISIIRTGEGDGTVLRSSALLDERRGGSWQPTVVSPIQFHWTLFLPEEHVKLTRGVTFRDNVLHWLLEDPRYTLHGRNQHQNGATR